ncbi:MAG: IS110 family transposase, partial [Bacteroidota bacterium]
KHSLLISKGTKNMENYYFTVGIDVSKSHLDFAVFDQLNCQSTEQIPNKSEAIESFLVRYAKKYPLSKTLFCLEYTGLYSNFLLTVLYNHQVATWIENPVQIKRSMGLQKGENDQIDAQRIAEYAFRFQDQVKLYEPENQILEKIKELHQVRTQLVQTHKELNTVYQEKKKFLKQEIGLLIADYYDPILEELKVKMKSIEKKLIALLAEDEDLQQKMKIITSIPGVGAVTARALLIATQGFTPFDNGRQLACYCGVAPFENQSGRRRSKARVSHFANKKLKSLLHMCELNAVRMEGELKVYYERKVAQKKSKMLVLNAVRNKGTI